MKKTKTAKKKVKPKKDKDDKFEEDISDEEIDLGGSEPPQPIKNLKLIVDNGKDVIFQDKLGFTYLLTGAKLRKIGI